jgi:uncharacterized membrane protein
MVLLAALFALKVAVDKGWFGPAFRIAAGFAVGVSAWALALRLYRHNYRWLVSALSGAGMGVLFGTIFAGVSLFGLLPHLLGFVLLAGVSVVAIVQAVRLSDRFMAHLGLVGGVLTPVLVSTGENRPIALFSYVTLLVVGALVVARRRSWPDLSLSALVGAAFLYAGWSAAYHQPDQAPVALVAAMVLMLPFTAVALRREETLEGGNLPVAVVGVFVFALAGAAWLAPIDADFIDPRSGLVMVRPFGPLPIASLIGTLLLPTPALFIARQRKSSPLAGAATLLSSLLLTIFAIGWAAEARPPALALSAAACLPSAVAFALLIGRSALSRALLPLPLAAGLALSLLGAAVPGEGGLFFAGLAGLILFTAAAALSLRDGWLLGALLFGLALPLFVVSADVEAIGPGFVASAALISTALLTTLPLRTAWHRDGRLPSVVAALAPLFFFPPLYQCWKVGFGDPVIGALPALLAGMALLGAAAQVRLHRATDTDGLLAVFVGVALLGATAALPIQLHDAWLTVAWALEAAALARLSRRLRHPLVPWAAVLLSVAVGVRLLLNPWALSYGDTAGLPILNWTLYTWGLPAVALLLASRWLEGRVPAFVRLGLLLTSVALGFALVNVQVSDFFQDSGPVELGGSGVLQGMVRSLSWAAYGVTILVVGLARDHRVIRIVGFGVVLLGTAKVFIVDLWALSGFVRVGSVLGLGMSLLVAAFLFERLVLRRSPPPAAGDEG